MRTMLRIAREQWRQWLRDRIAGLGLALLLLLTIAAALTAWEQRGAAHAERARDQAHMDHAFEAQPDRHPHRMVHFGHFVFRPLNPLAAFDPGVDAYTGHTLFLEGHRQNSANFGDVRQSSVLLRFGQLTPAFTLQLLAPLLLIFMGYATVARERESGLLRVLLAQGVQPWQIVAGKFLALAGVALLALAPALAALAWIAATTPAPAGLALALAAGYAVWLLIWAAGVIAVSSVLAHGRDAMLVLLAAWAVGVVLLPRVANEYVASTLALPTRFESDIAVHRELSALGDSHNPDDPYFNAFRQKVLAQHGVSRVEELPLNYKGLLGQEGERLTSELFGRHARANADLQRMQLASVDRFAILSPVIALRRLSMAAAGTDMESDLRFQDQAEQHRYRLVQQLNRLQAEKLDYAGDRSSRDDRISHTHWAGMAPFRFQGTTPREAMARAAPAAAVLLGWLAVAIGLLSLAARRLQRSAP